MSILSENKAVEWFKNAVKNIVSKIPEGMVDVSTRKHPPIGEIALFKYDPKWKDDDNVLPYYDVNPLVLMVKIEDGDNFFGINLHYIPPPIRVKIIKEMVKMKKAAGGDEKAYIKKVMPLLAAYGDSALFGHTYKHYLTKHVRSKFAIIKPSFWTTVGRLPLQDFKKASQKQVWEDATTAKAKKARSRWDKTFGIKKKRNKK